MSTPYAKTACAWPSPLFLDSAPILYFLEGHPAYAEMLETLFRLLRKGQINSVASPITLAECLLGLPGAGERCARLIVRDLNALVAPIDRSIVRLARDLRARHGLTLGDALQWATAMDTGCRGFLTNDPALARMKEIPVLLLDQWRPEVALLV